MESQQVISSTLDFKKGLESQRKILFWEFFRYLTEDTEYTFFVNKNSLQQIKAQEVSYQSEGESVIQLRNLDKDLL